MKDSLEIMRRLDLPVEQVRATGGGARSALWRELQADVYGLPIHRTTADEGPAHGAALLAGVAAGVYADVEEACSTVRLREEVTEPHPGRTRIYDELYETYRSLYPATREAMHRLAGLAAGEQGGAESG
jgi:xylulokinase